MNQADKELARQLWDELRDSTEESRLQFAHRYHIAKLEQVTSGFDEWFTAYEEETLSHPSFDTRVLMGKAYQAGAASQQPKIAALEGEVAELRQNFNMRHEADMRAVAMWREKTGKELTLPDHADLVCWLSEEVERLKEQLVKERHRLQVQVADEQQQRITTQLDNKRLRDEGQAMVRSYVRLIEAGRDRITSLGGDCDPVDVMEANDPALNKFKAAISTPLDTSAADELQAKHDHWKAEAMCYADQITAARSALEDERDAWTDAADGEAPDSWLYGFAHQRISAITRALGEEQKKEGEE